MMIFIILQFIIIRLIGWDGHVVNVGGLNYAYLIVVENLKGRAHLTVLTF
jgi:hypothetical protein